MHVRCAPQEPLVDSVTGVIVSDGIPIHIQPQQRELPLVAVPLAKTSFERPNVIVTGTPDAQGLIPTDATPLRASAHHGVTIGVHSARTVTPVVAGL
jgi:hypothetical protein